MPEYFPVKVTNLPFSCRTYHYSPFFNSWEDVKILNFSRKTADDPYFSAGSPSAGFPSAKSLSASPLRRYMVHSSIGTAPIER